ncbi:MAG: hypothetical protein RJA63_3597 [Pseudomonadota bacterium]|jgi:holin-like protein
MLNGYIAILGCLLTGEILVYLLALPLPGPVLGMGLALVWLTRGGEAAPAPWIAASQSLLKHLALLFVPAGTGLILHLARLQGEWLALGSAVVLGTLITLAASAWLLARQIRPRGSADD